MSVGDQYVPFKISLLTAIGLVIYTKYHQFKKTIFTWIENSQQGNGAMYIIYSFRYLVSFGLVWCVRAHTINIKMHTHVTAHAMHISLHIKRAKVHKCFPCTNTDEINVSRRASPCLAAPRRVSPRLAISYTFSSNNREILLFLFVSNDNIH